MVMTTGGTPTPVPAHDEGTRPGGQGAAKRVVRVQRAGFPKATSTGAGQGRVGVREVTGRVGGQMPRAARPSRAKGVTGSRTGRGR